MKKYALCMMACIALLSCSEDKIEPYGGDAYIQFYRYSINGASYVDKVEISFGYEPMDVVDSTVNISTMMVGKLIGEDRTYEFEQILVDEDDDEGIWNAASGVNYAPFDSDEFDGKYVLKGDQGYANLPVKIFRPAEGETFILKLQLVENTYFKAGVPEKRTFEITYHSDLRKPGRWVNSFYGQYSRTKHQWMIDNTGEKWDDAFTKTVSDTRDLYQYWQLTLRMMLAEENARRADDSLEPLKDENGFMSFDPYYG